jgi:RNA polymerase sigma factor (sigma-70 family)
MATFNYRDDERKARIFETELYPFLDAVYNFAVRLTNDASRADDLVQETFMKAWRFIDSYQQGTNAKAWLFRICKNAFINEFRAKSREPQAVDIDVVRIGQNPGNGSKLSNLHLLDEIGQGQIGDELLAAINALNPDNRIVVLLDYEDFSYKEIAIILDIPLNTVRTRLFRARKGMSEVLADYAQARGYNVQGNRKQDKEGKVLISS